MNGAVCVDASVAVKWILPEPHSGRALAMLRDCLQTGGTLAGPPHLPVEVTSAVYKRFRTGELTADEAQGRLGGFAEIPVSIFFPPGLSRLAFGLSAEFGWPLPYDAFYLAVGEIIGCDVWTADKEFYNDAHGKYQRLRFLADYESPQG